MGSRIRVAVLLVAALLAALVVTGLSSTLASAPQASACGNHPGCWKNKNAVSTILFDGVTPIIAGRVVGAQRGSDPFDATGFGKVRFTLSQGLVSVEGPVTCLDVRGNTVGGVIRFDKASVPTLVGMEQYATFIDGGPGGANDRFAVSPSPVPAGTTKSCAPQPAIAIGPFLSGDVTIKDGKLGGAKK